MKNSWFYNRHFQRLFWVAFFLGIWEILARSENYSPLIFPPLREILKALYSSVLEGALIQQSIYTLELIFYGFVIALSFAIVLSVLAFGSRLFEGLVDTLLAVAHPLPGLALLPLVILWLGTGAKSIVFIIVHSVLWPLLLNLLIGFKAIPKVYKQ
nr:ABC transporter permease [Desulfitobacterium hafniense]